MRLLNDVSNSEIEQEVRKLREQAQQYRNVAQSKDELADEYEGELVRREIARLPIKKGDKILVTPDMYPKYAKYMIGETESHEVVIDDIAAYDDDGVKAWSGNGGMTIEDALTMRRAYLEAHATESEVADDE